MISSMETEETCSGDPFYQACLALDDAAARQALARATNKNNPPLSALRTSCLAGELEVAEWIVKTFRPVVPADNSLLWETARHKNCARVVKWILDTYGFDPDNFREDIFEELDPAALFVLHNYLNPWNHPNSHISSIHIFG